MNIAQRGNLNIGNIGIDERSLSIPGDLSGFIPQPGIRKMFVLCTLADNANDKRIKLLSGAGMSIFDSSASLNGQSGTILFVFDQLGQNRSFITVWKDDAALFARMVNTEPHGLNLQIQGESDNDILVTEAGVNDSPLFS